MKELKYKNPIEELENDIYHEINIHKWLESQKAGKDLKEIAEKDWYDKHFVNWIKFQKNKAILELTNS